MVFDSVEKIVIFLITLSLLVVIHEGGHFWTARLNNVAVTEFAVGFGPAVASWRSKKSGTRYRLNLFPLGGYCAMVGEDGRRDDGGAVVQGVDYQTRSTWQRFAIIAAGPLVNLVGAFVILVLSALIIGEPSAHSSTVVGHMIAGQPAERAGLRPGDRILAVNGVVMADGEQLVHTINSSLGKTLDLRFSRGSDVRDVRVTAVPMVVNGRRIGITGFMPLAEYDHVPVTVAFGHAWRDVSEMFSSSIDGISQLIRHSAKAQAQMVGPVGMARAAMQIQDYGPGAYLWFAALISLSLGIFNLLPIPALDGGRLVFIVAEMLRGRPVAPDREALVHLAGFALLIGFVLFRTYYDVLNAIAGKAAI